MIPKIFPKDSNKKSIRIKNLDLKIKQLQQFKITLILTKKYVSWNKKKKFRQAVTGDSVVIYTIYVFSICMYIFIKMKMNLIHVNFFFIKLKKICLLFKV